MKRRENVQGSSRVGTRAVDELVGICRGLLADGELNLHEAMFLKDWIARSEGRASGYPFDVLYRRLAEALRDGVMDSDEEADLLGVLAEFVGGETFDAQSGSTSLSSALPLCQPPPLVDHAGATFVVTGTFESGSRTDVCGRISGLGGIVRPNVTLSTTYLLVGGVASRDWAHSSYGRKIEAAVRNREQGSGIAIVSEQHWTTCC